MALERITNPPVLDSTGLAIVQKLEAIKNVVQPVNAGTDIDITIPSSGWSSESPYQYTYSNAHITSGSLVKVTFLEGSGTSTPLYLEFEKVTNGVRFEAPAKPTNDISVRIHIFSADTTSTAATSADEVSTSAVSGASNVDDALRELNSTFGYAMPVSYDGKTPTWISGGEYILVLGGSLTPGLYIANQGMSAGTTLTSSNVSISVYGNLANDMNRKYETLNSKLTPTTLWANNSGTTSGEITMSEAITNFHFILLKYRTNGQEVSQLVNTELSYEIFQDVNLFSSDGSQSDYSYKTTCLVNFTSSTKATVRTSYTNPNLILRVMTIFGVLRK